MRLERVVAFLALFSGLCRGQATEPCKPSSLNIPGAKFPCVYPDGRATFRIVAPDAQKVQVRVGRPFDMDKGPDGAWTVTTTPLVVGFHYYSVVIDGATVADPATRTFFGSGWENSGIEIPEPADVDYYLPKDVPHGRVESRGCPEVARFRTNGPAPRRVRLELRGRVRPRRQRRQPDQGLRENRGALEPPMRRPRS